MSGYLVGLLTFIAGIITAAIGELLSDEVRDRLDEIPHAILGLAARMLDSGQRETVYRDEWLPELTYILKGSEARPITRLIIGTRYPVGIAVSTRRIARHLHRPALGEPDQTATSSVAAALLLSALISIPLLLQAFRPSIDSEASHRSYLFAEKWSRTSLGGSRSAPKSSWPQARYLSARDINCT